MINKRVSSLIEEYMRETLKEMKKGEIRIMDNRTIEEVRKNETKLINEIKVLEQQYKKAKRSY